MVKGVMRRGKGRKKGKKKRRERKGEEAVHPGRISRSYSLNSYACERKGRKFDHIQKGGKGGKKKKRRCRIC